MPLFIVTGLLGLLFFIGALFFGDHDVGHDHDFDGDHDHGGPSVFSVFNVAWFLIGFGGMGAVVMVNGAGMPASTISGLATGIVSWGIAFYVMYLLTKQQGDSTVTTARIKDATGTVTLSISANGVGKIQCTVAGSLQEFLARSANSSPLSAGSQVRVVGDAGGACLGEALPKKEDGYVRFSF